MIENIKDIPYRLNKAYELICSLETESHNLIPPLETESGAEGLLITKKYLKGEEDYLKKFSDYHDKNISYFLEAELEKNYQEAVKKYENSRKRLNGLLERLEKDSGRKLN